MANTTGQIDLCRAGGKHGDHANYGKYHVTGAVYTETGEELVCKNCVFCGRDCSTDFVGGIYGN